MNPNLATQPCDLCGSPEARFLLSTPRLDGPLMRCRRCRLCYVIMPEPLRPEAPPTAPPSPRNGDGPPAADEMRRLAERARELALVEPEVEEREAPWRQLTAAERLADLKRFIDGGRLLEVGCSTGELLVAASLAFAVTGVEADAASSCVARARGLECINGTLFDAGFPEAHFDAAALYHVIEHLPSPRRALGELHRIVRPRGWLAIETPNIATLWFRLLGARWRQFIPDHRFFFTPETIRRLCVESGFDVRELRPVGKQMSVRLFISRLGRYHQPLARALSTLSDETRLSDRTLRLNLGDVMRLYAVRK